MESCSEELEARVLWKQMGWFRFIKWPSVGEVDFGGFLVVYDLKGGKISLEYLDGRSESLAEFDVGERGVDSIGKIRGALRGRGFEVMVQAFEEAGLRREFSVSMDGGELFQYSVGEVLSPLTEDGCFSIHPVREKQNDHLKVRYERDQYRRLSILLASLVVFNRYQSTGANGDDDAV